MLEPWLCKLAACEVHCQELWIDDLYFPLIFVSPYFILVIIIFSVYRVKALNTTEKSCRHTSAITFFEGNKQIIFNKHSFREQQATHFNIIIQMSTAIQKAREAKQINPIMRLNERQITIMHIEHEVRKILCHSFYHYYYFVLMCYHL